MINTKQPVSPTQPTKINTEGLNPKLKEIKADGVPIFEGPYHAPSGGQSVPVSVGKDQYAAQKIAEWKKSKA